jgi:hypothetical protein
MEPLRRHDTGERLACLIVPLLRMRGVVHLPFAVLFSEDALGGNLSGATDRAVFTLNLPRLPADADEAGFFLGPPGDESWPNSRMIEAGGWGHLGFEGRQDGRRIVLASWVNAVAIEIETYDDEDREPWQVTAEFGPTFNRWYSNWLEWVGIWTGLPSAVDRGMAINTQGHVQVERSGSDGFTGWSPGATVRAYPSHYAATRAIAEAAARRASTPEPPPLEWRLLNIARVLQDNRRAIIDAATASEVALAHALRTRLNAIQEEALEAKIHSANGLVGLLKLVEQIDGTEKRRWPQVRDRRARPRNSCVHRGIEPTGEEVRGAIEEAHALLETYSPLPELTSTQVPESVQAEFPSPS